MLHVRTLHTEELNLLFQLYQYNNPKEMLTENARDINDKKIEIFGLFRKDRLIGELHVAYVNEDERFAVRNRRAYLFAFRIHEEYQGDCYEYELYLKICKEHGKKPETPKTDHEVTRKELQCRIYPFGFLERYKYTVICTSYQGKWVLSKHRNRDTWETQGGHLEEGETPLECAISELFEESGIKDADLYPVCDYWGFNRQSSSNGIVFLAEAHSLGELPESEVKEIKAFDTLPEKLTYPNVSPKLIAEAQNVLKKGGKT